MSVLTVNTKGNSIINVEISKITSANGKSELFTIESYGSRVFDFDSGTEVGNYHATFRKCALLYNDALKKSAKEAVKDFITTAALKITIINHLPYADLETLELIVDLIKNK